MCVTPHAMSLLCIAGITSNNTIYAIAFMICWGENHNTLKKFFDIMKANRPSFYEDWLDKEETTLIGDRGPGCCLKAVVHSAFKNGDKMLRSCVVHVIRGVRRNFSSHVVNALGHIHALAACENPKLVDGILDEIKLVSPRLFEYIMKTDITYWVPAFIMEDKAHFFKVCISWCELASFVCL
jgi:hypothetical protein